MYPLYMLLGAFAVSAAFANTNKKTWDKVKKYTFEIKSGKKFTIE